MIELLSKLADKTQRPKAIKQLTNLHNAESIFIFIKDSELNIMLPAPGFPQTLANGLAWHMLLRKAVKHKVFTSKVASPTKNIKSKISAISYNNSIVYVVIGGDLSPTQSEQIYQVLPLLATNFSFELKEIHTSLQLTHAEKTVIENKLISQKLENTRRELQASLLGREKEIKIIKQAEEIITQDHERLSSLFDQAPVAFAIVRGQENIIDVANPLMCELWGKTQKDVINKPLLAALPEIKGQGFDVLLNSLRKTGKPYIGNEVPANLMRKGSLETGYFNFVYKPVREKSGSYENIIIVGTEVTEHINARKKVEESEAKLSFMAESMPQKVFTAKPDGTVDYFNSVWMEYTGLSFEQIRDWGWTQFIHPDDIEENISSWQHSIDTGKPFILEHRFRRHDGVYHWHLSRAQVLRDAKGKVVMWIGSNTDIEHLKQTTMVNRRLELLTKQRNALIKLNKAKNDFTAVASHQLRTPATAVKQYISLLMDEYAGEVTPDQLQYLQIAYDSNERQLTIVNDLLKTAQMDAKNFTLNKSSQNIVQLASEVIHELKPILELRKQTVTLDTDNANISARVDRLEIKLVISNLIENASKYAKPNKNITVKVAQKNQNVQISVIDEGVGISKENLKRIFDKFTRVDNELSDTVTGTGLGLYWVKRIVKLHKGSVDLTSTLNEGSTFMVSLPL